MQPKIAVIILTYRTWETTIQSAEAVLAIKSKHVSLLLIDNASPNDSEARLRRRFPETAFIQTGSNLGYAGGNNVGITWALSNGFDYVLILNNDCIIDPACIDMMLKAAEQDKNVGMVTPKVYAEKNIISHAGSNFSWKSSYLTSSRGAGQADNGQFDQATESQTATGDCLLVRSQVFKDIGLLDDTYFLYYEDTDFCHRARQAGYNILYQPLAIAVHPGSLSTGGVNKPLGAYYILRNKFYFVWRYGPFTAQLFTLAHLVLSFTKNGLYALLGKNKQLAQARLLALRHALGGVRGYSYRNHG